MNIERNSRHINYIWVLSWAINYKHKVEKLKKRLFRTLTTCLLHNDQWEHFHIGNNWIPVSRKTVVRSLRANSKAFTFPRFLANLQRFSLFFLLLLLAGHPSLHFLYLSLSRSSCYFSFSSSECFSFFSFLRSDPVVSVSAHHKSIPVSSHLLNFWV